MKVMAGGTMLAAAGGIAAWLGRNILPTALPPASDAGRSAKRGGGDGGGESIDWEALRRRNPDVIGWVEVPGTSIDYPIVQAHADDPEHWLHYDLDGNWSEQGCPYLDSSCAEKGLMSPGSWIFGHSLINGTMFSDVQHYSDAAYFNGHRKIMLSTPDWDRELTAVAARVVDADVTPMETGFESVKAAWRYLRDSLKYCAVVDGAPSEPTRWWCLVSCSYQTDNSRTLLFCIEA